MAKKWNNSQMVFIANGLIVRWWYWYCQAPNMKHISYGFAYYIWVKYDVTLILMYGPTAWICENGEWQLNSTK